MFVARHISLYLWRLWWSLLFFLVVSWITAIILYRFGEGGPRIPMSPAGFFGDFTGTLHPRAPRIRQSLLSGRFAGGVPDVTHLRPTGVGVMSDIDIIVP